MMQQGKGHSPFFGLSRKMTSASSIHCFAFLALFLCVLSVPSASAAMGGSRPPYSKRLFHSTAIDGLINSTISRMKNPDLAILFENTLPNTLDTTVYYNTTTPKPDTFVITGDIAAMWSRDSMNQVLPYIAFASQDSHLDQMIQGLIHRFSFNFLHDAYANAYNKDQSVSPWLTDHTYKVVNGKQVLAMTPWLWERKFEVDSLGAFLRLSAEYYEHMSSLLSPAELDDIYDANWLAAYRTIYSVLRTQQAGTDEEDASGLPPAYQFQRLTFSPTDTLIAGRGAPARRCGLVKGGFRPSDDSSLLPFHIPANILVATQLQRVSQLLLSLGYPADAADALTFSEEIFVAVERHGIITHPKTGDLVYAYEIDGAGSYYFMDDANVPSLLSIPYISNGQIGINDKIYQNTRSALLNSETNVYFFKGTVGEGIGGPHVGDGYIWPMSIAIRGLTSNDASEVSYCLDMLIASSANTGFMHESFNADDASDFTRSWFAWANGLFGEFVLDVAKRFPQLLF